MNKFFKALLFCCLFELSLSNACAKTTGETAPDFSLETLDGKKVSLAELKGKVVYLDFWASWCGPCRFSLPFMNTLEERYGKDGLVVLAVNIDSDRARVEKALSSINPKYSVLLDPKSSVPALYDPPKMPSSFIIGKDGKISAVHAGFNNEETAEINSAIEAALKEGK